MFFNQAAEERNKNKNEADRKKLLDCHVALNTVMDSIMLNHIMEWHVSMFSLCEEASQ